LQSLNDSFNSIQKTASDFYSNSIQPLADQANGLLDKLNPLASSIQDNVAKN
jgi:uncharacterized protein YoxC